MLYVLIALTILAFLFVLFTLIMGAKNMGGKTEGAREQSNIWMRRRVLGQVIAVGLLMLTVYVKTRM
ncbi:hypoxia induced protein [Litorimonas taeanensis]|uniref:Hypoxia induced protein n=1 Tax=Litorimonas taeanensis TaxID=568099 RepID=A0A420WF45_9PROT|nr:HIG1 domain-containing protein [Litorimonas taeanensis]RKQ69603.1 hypoxia induced protein [Litorimonas taeanensis]